MALLPAAREKQPTLSCTWQMEVHGESGRCRVALPWNPEDALKPLNYGDSSVVNAPYQYLFFLGAHPRVFFMRLRNAVLTMWTAGSSLRDVEGRASAPR